MRLNEQSDGRMMFTLASKWYLYYSPPPHKGKNDERSCQKEFGENINKFVINKLPSTPVIRKILNRHFEYDPINSPLQHAIKLQTLT